MTNQPSVTDLMRRAAQLAGDDFAAPTAADFAHRRKQRRTTVLAVTTGIVVVAAIASVTAAVSGGTHHGRSSLPAVTAPTAIEAPWLVYRNSTWNFSVEYPPTWRVGAPGGINPAGFDEQVAALGTVLVTEQCHPYEGTATECRLGPDRRLAAGDVAVNWTSSGGPGQQTRDSNNPVRSTGRPTQVDGMAAWELTTTGGQIAGECKETLDSTSGGTRQVDVSIELRDGQSLDMSACLGGSTQQLDTLQAEVLRSVQSLNLTG